MKQTIRSWVEQLEDRTVLSVGQLDPGFGNNGLVVTDFTDLTSQGSYDNLAALATMPDGRIVAAGGYGGTRIARYLSNGELDPSFGVQGQLSSDLSEIHDLAVLADGSLLLAGNFHTSQGDGDFAVLKLHVDGTLYTTFGGSGLATVDIRKSGFNDQALAMHILADGSILVAGGAGNSQGYQDFAVAKFDSMGFLDTNFGTGGVQYVDFDPLRNSNDAAHDVLVDSANKIVLIGSTTRTNGTDTDFALVRLTAAGQLDTGFGTAGKVKTDFGQQNFDQAFSGALITIQNVEVIVVGGYSNVSKTGGMTDSDFAFAAYNSNGTLRLGFGDNGRKTIDFAQNSNVFSHDSISQIAAQDNGQIVAVGSAVDSGGLYSSRTRSALVRINNDGSLDQTPNPSAGGRIYGNYYLSQFDSAQAIAIQADGKWVVGGYTSDYFNFGVARYEANSGQLDTTWDNDGLVVTDFSELSYYGSYDNLKAVATMPDGRIVAVGGEDARIARYLPDGTLDVTFGIGGRLASQLGRVHNVAVLEDGSLLLAGGIVTSSGGADFGVLKLHVDGTLDTNFGARGLAVADIHGSGYDDEAYAITVLSDGSILLAGYAGASMGEDFGVAKFDSGGILDTSFGTGGTQYVRFNSSAPSYSNARDMLVDPQNRIVLFGVASATGRNDSDFALARLTPNGQYDVGFGTGGKVLTDFGQQNDDGAGSGVLVMIGGEPVLVAGGYATVSKTGGVTDRDFAFAAYNSNGTLRLGFGTDGRKTVNFAQSSTVHSDDEIFQLALQSNGQIVAAGSAEDNSPLGFRSRIALLRINSDGSLDATPNPAAGGRIYSNFYLSQDDWSQSIAILPNGSWLVGGTTDNGYNFAVASYLPASGQLDTDFGNNGLVVTDFTDLSQLGSEDQLTALATMEDGRIIAVGGDSKTRVSRYLANGKLDLTFGIGGRLASDLGEISDVSVLADGSLLLAGTISTSTGGNDFAVLKLRPDGTLDTSFGGGGFVTADIRKQGYDDHAFAIAVLADGSILVAGGAGNSLNGFSQDFGVAKFTSAGIPVPAFGNGGTQYVNFDPSNISFDAARDILIDASNRIVLIGSAEALNRSDRDFALARLTASGQLDVGFGSGGKVRTDFGQQNDDEAISGVLLTIGGLPVIVAGGYSTVSKTGGSTDDDFALAAYNVDGTLRLAFGTDGRRVVNFSQDGSSQSDDQIGQIAVQSNGQIVAAGSVGDQGPFDYRYRTAVVRFNTDGGLDQTPNLATGGRIYGSYYLSQEDTAQAIVIQSDGKWLIGGTANDGNDFGLMRYLGDNSAPTEIQISNLSIAENNLANANVGTLTATDSDTGSTFTFSLVAGTGSGDNGSFSITSNVLSISQITNFEAKSSYSIRVRVTDQDGLVLEKSFVISITDVNESPTDISLSTSSIVENNSSNATVGTLSSSDPDTGNTFTYSLVAGTGSGDNGSFSISGNILRITPSTNFETKNSYSIRVRVTDQGGLMFEKPFTISVTDVNETPTDISLSASSIAENNPPNATVGTLSASDPDAGNTFTYNLVTGTGSGDNGSFSISGNILRITSSTNYETKSAYSIRVRVTDQGGLTFEKPFTISVTDVNEAPTDVTLSASSIAENNLANATVGILGAIDPNPGNTFTFSLAAGTGSADNGNFSISGDILRITPSTNFETKSSYSIRVRVTDQGGLTFEKPFTISVTDVNEAPTDISLSVSSISENNSPNSTIGTFSTSDPDSGNTYTYGLVTGAGSTDNGSFSISGSSLRIIPSTDFETKNSYSIRVRATDQGGLTVSKPFTITITNVGEAPVLDLNGGAAGTGFSTTFTTGGSTVSIVDANNLIISDVDSTNLSGATVTISNLSNGSSEILDVTLPGGSAIQKSYSNGVLTLSGNSSLASFQSALRTLTYRNTANPSNPMTRSITVVVNDGALNSPQATATVAIDPGTNVLDIDGSGALDGFTDGALVLGYLNGLSDNQLDKFRSNGASRTVVEIKTYLDGLKSGTTLDVDGSGGVPDGFTDGALVLGYLLGLNETQLSKFIALGATRTVTQIKTYLDQLTGNSQASVNLSIPAPPPPDDILPIGPVQDIQSKVLTVAPLPPPLEPSHAEPPLLLDVDGSGGVPDGFTDGALLLGYLANLTNSQLERFLATNATRNVSEIRTYLDQLKVGSLLDADGSGGVPGGFTDGALLFGRLASVSDIGLAKYIPNDATRSLTEIRSYIAALIESSSTGPVITIPGPVTIPMSSSLPLPDGMISIAASSVDRTLEVTLSAIGEGVITLNGIGGLSFSQGTGTANDFMTFQGTESLINAALSSLIFTPSLFTGISRLRISVSDLGHGDFPIVRTSKAQMDVTIDSSIGQGPDLQLITDSSDPRAVHATRPDGTTIDYFGIKNEEGVLTTLTSATVNLANGTSQEVQYDIEGRITNVSTSDGGLLNITWNSATDINVTVRTGNGSADVVIPYTLPNVSAASAASNQIVAPLVFNAKQKLSASNLMETNTFSLSFNDYCNGVAQGITFVCTANEAIGGNKYGLCAAIAAESGPALPEVLALCTTVFASTDLVCSTLGASPAPGAPNVAASICEFIETRKPQSKLEVNPASLAFTVSIGDGESLEKTFTIVNKGDLLTDFTITSSLGQVHLSQSTGQLDAHGQLSVDVSAIADGLTPGEYPATITITTSSQTLTVTVTLTVVVGIAAVSPIEMSFEAYQGQDNPPTQSFTVTNNGPTFSRLHYSVQPNTGRPIITRVDGNPTNLAPGSTNIYNITINTAGLDSGVYKDFVDIINTDDPSQIVTIEITTTINEVLNFKGTYSGAFESNSAIIYTDDEYEFNQSVSGFVRVRVDNQEFIAPNTYKLYGVIDVNTDRGSFQRDLIATLQPSQQTGVVGRTGDGTVTPDGVTAVIITLNSIDEHVLAGFMKPLTYVTSVGQNEFGPIFTGGFSILVNVPIELRL